MTMQTERLVLDRAKARELWQQYKSHQHYSTPIDLEVQRAYKLIAQGRVVIKALESIKASGADEHGLPRLAIVRADAKDCFFRVSPDGSAVFSAVDGWGTSHWHRRHRVPMPVGSFPGAAARRPNQWGAAKANVPLVPIHLRPKRGLANYHILFEAEWEPVPPRDPMLLRRIGKGDMWLVVAAWDLTEIERAAMAARISS